MLDIKFIRQNLKKVKTACQNRGVECNLDKLLALDEKRRDLIQKSEQLRAEKKKELGIENKELGKNKKEKIKALEGELTQVEKDFLTLMYKIPNIPYPDVPVHQNEEVKKWGEIPKGDFKEYLEIAGDLIDTERAAKTSGSRFYYLKDNLALLELNLIHFVANFLSTPKIVEKIVKDKKLNISTKSFIPVIPPLMLKSEIMKGMGYLDQAPDETYHLEKDDLYLIGTAEQALVAMHANEILLEKDLPIRYVGLPCSSFRREAGSYGKDVKGIFRVHQFEKVEMVSLTTPEQSAAEQELMLALEEEIVQTLKLSYRVLKICTGELAWPSAKTYDIECYLPGQKKYGETHSCSNCTDFQARRLNIRYRNKEGKNNFVHTLNATGLAMPRAIIAIIENYQKKDGTFDWPEVLK